MKCQDDSKEPTRRCQIEGINWATDPKWSTCPSCGEQTVLECVDEAVLTQAQSLAREASIKQEREDELNEAAERLERTVTAATAALNYDLDHWAELDPDEWLGGAAC